MTYQTLNELNDNFLDKENELNFEKTNTSTITDSIYLYGMTLEEYQEGIEIHSKCFDQIKNLMN